MAYRYPPPPVARHAADSDEDHFFDVDDRLAMGNDEEYDYRKARVSWLSVTGLVLGVIGTLATLTGDLTPVGFAAGLLGLMLAVGGFVASGRPYVASRPLALLAVAVTVAAVVLAILAANGEVDWLNREDQTGWFRNWINERVPGVTSW